MRSDFYSLPWAAQQAIRRGQRAAGEARARNYDVAELQKRVDNLQRELATAEERIATLEREKEALRSRLMKGE